MLLKAVAKLKVEGFDVSTVLVGKEIENVGVHALAEQLEVSDRVWFYGPCYDEEKLAELFYNATVCVSPGNVGLTAIHSLTYGCPVITHDNLSDQMPEFEAVRPCLTGDFFKEDSVESLTNVIKQWIGLITGCITDAMISVLIAFFLGTALNEYVKYLAFVQPLRLP